MRALSPEQRRAGSELAAVLLEKQAAWQIAKSILFYAPLPDEVDIWRLFEDSLKAGKRVFLPKFVPRPVGHDGRSVSGVSESQPAPAAEPEKHSSHRAPQASAHRYVACEVRNPEKDLHTGQFGIREPNATCPEVPLNRLDFVLVPGIAFDLHGRRVGRGKGYYDHLLADVRGKTCGVAFDEQIVCEAPVEPHDILVNCILTPTRWVEL